MNRLCSALQFQAIFPVFCSHPSSMPAAESCFFVFTNNYHVKTSFPPVVLFLEGLWLHGKEESWRGKFFQAVSFLQQKPLYTPPEWGIWEWFLKISAMGFKISFFPIISCIKHSLNLVLLFLENTSTTSLIYHIHKARPRAHQKFLSKDRKQ